MKTEKNEFAISVIIPFYNVEKYFQDCLDSLSRQTFQNFETILINDGSTDTSGEIAKRYASSQKNVTIITKNNEGQGKARNQGLMMARGEYIYFLDSDDYILDQTLENLWKAAKLYGADLILFEGKIVHDNSVKKNIVEEEYRFKRIEQYPEKLYNGMEIFYKLRRNKDYSCSVCRQLILRKVLAESKTLFPEKTIHEDELYSFYVFMNCQRVHILPEVLFCRRYRSGSTMTSKKGRRNFQGYQNTCMQIADWYQSHDILKEWKKNARICAGDFFREAIYGVFFRLPLDEQNAIKKEVRDFVLFAKREKGFGDWRVYLICVLWKPYCWYRQNYRRKS